MRTCAYVTIDSPDVNVNTTTPILWMRTVPLRGVSCLRVVLVLAVALAVTIMDEASFLCRLRAGAGWLWAVGCVRVRCVVHVDNVECVYPVASVGVSLRYIFYYYMCVRVCSSSDLGLYM